MDSFIQTDPFQLVQNYLSCADLHSLATINKDIYNYCKRSFGDIYMKKIYNRLKDIFNDDTDRFLKLLDDAKAYISGSFILQCLTNENFDDSDIDIFFPDCIINGKLLSAQSMCFSPIDDFLYKDLKYTWNDGHRYIDNIGSDQLQINFIRTYKKNNVEIQLMYISNNDVKKFIIDTFDFDICKNMYRNKNLYIDSFEDIIHRETKFKYAYRLGATIKRGIKYQKRGFKFTNLNKLCYNSLVNDILPLKNKLVSCKGVIVTRQTDIIGLEHTIRRCPQMLNPQLVTTCTNDDCIIKLFGMHNLIPHYHTATVRQFAGIHPDVVIITDNSMNW